MAHKLGSTFTVNVKFQGSFSDSAGGRVYFPNNANKYADAMEWDQYETSNIVAAGSNMDLTDGTSSGTATNCNQGPQFLAQFVPPVDCRLIGLSATVDFYNPSNGWTHLRLGAVKMGFDDGDANTVDAVWTSLGYIDTDPQDAEEVINGIIMGASATFSSSNGDVDAGQGVGFLAQPMGGHAGTTYGTMTAVFRTI